MAVKNNDWTNYNNLVTAAQDEHKALLKKREYEAANHLGLTIDSYEKSRKDTMADPEYVRQTQMHDIKLAKDDVFKTVTESRAEIKQCYMELMQLDFEAFQNLQWYIAPREQMAAMQTLLMQRNFDTIYIKYGLKYFYLLQAAGHYKID